jgi:gliding motility-associated-like protein
VPAASITNLAAGTYTLTVTDGRGSQQSQSVTLTQPQRLVLSAAVTPETDEQKNGSATATVSGGTAPYQYRWSSGQTTAAVTNLAAGTYTVTVTDSKGCTTSQSITIGQTATITELKVRLNKTDVSCQGATDGSVSATISGGVTPYQYRWSSGETTASITNLAAGTYTLTVTDGRGSQQSQSVTLTQPQRLVLSAAVTPETDEQKNGSATATVSGGTAPYQYKWSSGQTTAIITDLAAGTYTLTVTDKNNCSVSLPVSVSRLTSPEVRITSFTLIDTDTGSPVAGHDPIADGATLNLSSISAKKLTIRANTSSELISKVVFNINTRESTDTSAPYAIGGTAGDQYKSYNFKAGSYELTATPYNADNRIGTYLTINFSVVDIADRAASRWSYETDERIKPKNVFSPNNDGIDDFWEIENIEKYPDYQILVYNRTGNKVFEAKTYINNWNGTHQGKPLISEVYYYVIRSSSGTTVKTGSVTLLR